MVEDKSQIAAMLQSGMGMVANAPSVKPMVAEGGGEDPITEEMKIFASKKFKLDGKTPIELSRYAAQGVGISPALLYSSAMQEGMNKALSDKYSDYASDAYLDLSESGKLDSKSFPVDGFYNYGLDTFGEQADKLIGKGYLPKDFNTRYTTFKAKNEKGGEVNSAAFRTHQDALIAKAAFIKNLQDEVVSMAKDKGVELDEESLNYFTLAGYNGGMGNAKKMLEEFANAKDKKSFISKGETSRKGVHTNISPRIARMLAASELFKTTTK